MRRTEILKYILLYFFMPEDTTEAGCRDNLIENPALYLRQSWLGPLKTVVWTVAAVIGPLLFCALLSQ
ncbi:MAG: hypothetical protein VR65_26630 [Desulfobulbaceae bacterium BRH_c16a]|nr:MAG: hypothetical protein VR65_26630 [Desulfobulbaceae bacterium BRH_c16a]